MCIRFALFIKSKKILVSKIDRIARNRSGCFAFRVVRSIGVFPPLETWVRIHVFRNRIVKIDFHFIRLRATVQRADVRTRRTRFRKETTIDPMTTIPTAEQLRTAYAAKQRYDEANAAYDIDGKLARANEAANAVRGGFAAALESVRTSASSVMSGAGGVGVGGSTMRAGAANAGATAGNARGERRWTCHACEKLEGGGRGPMQDGAIVQPAGVPMVLLEVKGEVVERTALPMGKDDLVKGEMLTLGKWLARVVGVEGATPEKPVVLTKPPAEVSENVSTQSQPEYGSPASQQQPAPYGERFQHQQPLLVTDQSAVGLATQTAAGGLQAPGARREYYQEPMNGAPQPSYGHHQSQAERYPPQQPRYQIYEPPPRYERAVDPDTGNPERWMGGGWRGRSYGDDRPRAVTQHEVDAARSRLLELEQEARVRAEMAHAEAMARQQQAEAARISAQSAMEQMNQAEAANRAVRDAEMAAAEAKRLAYFAAEHQREAESQFISMLPLDDVGPSAEERRRASELEDLQRRIAAHEQAAAAHVVSAPIQPPPQQPEYQPEYQPPPQQYRAPPAPAPAPVQYQQQQQPERRAPVQPVQVRYEPPSQPAHQSSPARAQAEIEYTSSPSSVKDRAAAFGHVTIKPKPASQASVNVREQTYTNHGSSSMNSAAHALAQVVQKAPISQSAPATAETTADELKRKIAILERLARSRGLMPSD
jgi:hypothetical protein